MEQICMEKIIFRLRKQSGRMVFFARIGRKAIRTLSVCLTCFGYAEVNRKYDEMGRCKRRGFRTGTGDCH